MSLINTSFCPFVKQETLCKICEGTNGAMESIFCRDTDAELLDKIHQSTGVRVRPVCGMISPVCEFCHARIDQFDVSFKPRCMEYVVEKVTKADDPEDDPFNCMEPVEEKEPEESMSLVVSMKEVSVPEIVRKAESDGESSVEDKVELKELTALLEKADKEDEDGFFEEMEEDDSDDYEPPERSKPKRRKKASNYKAVEPLKPLKEQTECKICGKFFTYIKDHMKMHTNDKKFKCPHCDRTFTQSSSLIYHVRKHTGEKPFQCDKCDKSFICKSHLLSHSRSHINDQPFQCEVCSKRFNQACNLTKHLRVHSGEKPYKCALCPKAFMNLSNKKAHEKRHRGERNFTCEICSKSFYDSHHLERHSHTHSSEKRFKCALCPKQFSTEPAWKSHSFKHNSPPKARKTKIKASVTEKSHKCESCPKVFAEQIQLERHRRRFHEQKNTGLVIIDPERAFRQLEGELCQPFRCSVCNKVFNKAQTLKSHLRTHLGDAAKFAKGGSLKQVVMAAAATAATQGNILFEVKKKRKKKALEQKVGSVGPQLVQLPSETVPETGQVVVKFEFQHV